MQKTLVKYLTNVSDTVTEAEMNGGYDDLVLASHLSTAVAE